MFKGNLTIDGDVYEVVGYDLRTSITLNILDEGNVMTARTTPGRLVISKDTSETMTRLWRIIATRLWSAKRQASAMAPVGDWGHSKASVTDFGDFSLHTGALYRCNFTWGPINLTLEPVDFVEVVEPDSSLSDDFSDNWQELVLKPLPSLSHYTSPEYRNLYSVQEIVDLHPDRDFSWLEGRNYEIVTKETLPSVIKTLLTHDGVISFDTETTGLDINYNSVFGYQDSDHLLGLVFSIEEGQAWYIPLLHTQNDIENVCDAKEVPALMEKYFRPILERKDIIAFNASYDSKVMMTYDIFPNVVYDVMLMYILSEFWIDGGVPDPDNPNVLTSSLKALTKFYLQRDSLELGLFIPGYEAATRAEKSALMDGVFLSMPYESVRLYACADTDNTLALFNYFMDGPLQRFGAEGMTNLESSIVNAVAYNEFYGIHYNADKFESIKEELDQEATEAYNKCVQIAGEEFNPNSPKQLQRIMYEVMGYPIREYTATGAPSTNKAVLSALNSEVTPDGEPRYPFVKYLVAYRDAEQERRSFVKGAEEGTQDGLMFNSVRQSVETGRMATSKPNIQGMGESVKKYFECRYDYYTMNFDFSSVEYRIIASMAKEDKLIEFFKDPLRDYHRFQAAVLFDMPYGRVTSKLRKQAKAFNFGIPYGKGNPSLGKDLFGTMSDENTEAAAKLRKKYFAGQPRVEQFFQTSYDFADKYGYVSTQFGRRRYFDIERLGRRADGSTDYRKGQAAARRQAGNHRVQGTAADLYKMGLRNFYRVIRKNGWTGKVLFTAFVHDEMNMEIHKSLNPVEVLKAVLDCFMIKIPGWAPLYMGMGFGTSWKEAKSQDLSVAVQMDILKRGYPEWDGDIRKFINVTEELRTAYMLRTVLGHLANQDHWGDDMDSDVDDFIHVLMGDEAAPGTHPTLENFINKHSDSSELADLIAHLSTHDIKDVFPDPAELADAAHEVVEESEEALVLGAEFDEETRKLDATDLIAKVNLSGVVYLPDTQTIVVKLIPELEDVIQKAAEGNYGSNTFILVDSDNELYSTPYKVSTDLIDYLTSVFRKYISERKNDVEDLSTGRNNENSLGDIVLV